MGLQSAMTTALTGLQAAETSIDVVGNNVANSSTIGFKESKVLFATQFLQTQSIGSAPSETGRGGTNPRQIGLGTKVAAINPNFTQGTVEISANPLDVAIQGDGFLIVQGASNERLYTRNGQLQTNAENQIVTVTGNRVLGYQVDEDFNLQQTLTPLEIPLGGKVVAQATQNVFFQGVLAPDADLLSTIPSVTESEVLGNGAIEVPDDSSFDLNDLNMSAPPTVSATTTALGAGALPAGDYSYRVAFYKNSGTAPPQEGAPTTSFGNITIGANQNIQIDNLPTDSTGNWDGRHLYRSVGGGAFELVADIADTTSAIYTDSDTTPGAAIDDTSLDSGNFSYYVTFFDTTTQRESRPTQKVGALSISDLNRRIRIDNIPQPTTPDFNAVRIYRNTGANTSEFHLVTTLEDGETTFIDHVPDADIVGQPQIDLIGPKATSGTALVDVVLRDGDVYSKPFVPGVVTFTGKKGDRTLAPKTLEIDNDTRLSELIDFMNEALGIDENVPAEGGTPDAEITAGGVIRFTSNMGIENALSVGLSGLTIIPTGSNTSQSIGMDFNETQVADGAGSTTDFIVFDSLGIPLNVRITTVMESRDSDSRTYRWYASSEDNEPSTGVDTALGNGTITFDGNGRIISGDEASIAVSRTITGAQSPLEFTLDFTQVSGLAVSNNVGDSSSSMSMTRQDGFPPGSLSSFIITESGLIRGVFSNGTERQLGQMRMARFANNSGLQQVGDNLYTTGVNSGEPIENDPGSSGLGALTAGAVELSNTDIGQNLIELILASTQYRGGTRVITAAQQLLDELMALRR